VLVKELQSLGLSVTLGREEEGDARSGGAGERRSGGNDAAPPPAAASAPPLRRSSATQFVASLEWLNRAGELKRYDRFSTCPRAALQRFRLHPAEDRRAGGDPGLVLW